LVTVDNEVGRRGGRGEVHGSGLEVDGAAGHVGVVWEVNNSGRSMGSGSRSVYGPVDGGGLGVDHVVEQAVRRPLDDINKIGDVDSDAWGQGEEAAVIGVMETASRIAPPMIRV
jgi:hypothetical protein